MPSHEIFCFLRFKIYNDSCPSFRPLSKLLRDFVPLLDSGIGARTSANKSIEFHKKKWAETKIKKVGRVTSEAGDEREGIAKPDIDAHFLKNGI